MHEGGWLARWTERLWWASADVARLRDELLRQRTQANLPFSPKAQRVFELLNAAAQQLDQALITLADAPGWRDRRAQIIRDVGGRVRGNDVTG